MFDLEIAAFISLIFVGSMGALAASIVAFLFDLNLSLLALGLDLRIDDMPAWTVRPEGIRAEIAAKEAQ
jgi:hypothetical protein